LKKTRFTLSWGVCLVALAGMATPVLALAQTKAPSVTDPLAAVPSVIYQSVFDDSPKGVETLSVDWKKANAEVGQFKRGHIDILKWEEAQAAQARPAEKPRASEPVGPSKPAAASPASSVHKH
jgi:hypothetical protein